MRLQWVLLVLEDGHLVGELQIKTKMIMLLIFEK